MFLTDFLGPNISRRTFLGRSAAAVGSTALAMLVQPKVFAGPSVPGAVENLHFEPKAKHIISIFCYGGPSQVDTFDPKPELLKRQGEAMTGVGDYVVSGGDLPAMLVIDSLLRLLPGAIDPLSAEEESFSHGLLEYPQYTRPPEFRGEGVPDILVSGHHGEVARWRAEQALEWTRRRRPDLLGGRREER